MNAEQTILSRGLPKTGQSVGYGASDDGYVEAGWWQGRKIIGNKTRFIVKTLNDDDVVIDLATGLMWAADGNSVACSSGNAIIWDLASTHCDGLGFAGFDDWRLPNAKELMSIIDYALGTPAIKQPPFANTKSSRYWSSTTRQGSIIYAWDVDFSDGIVWYGVKAGSNYVRPVRGGV